VAQAPALVGQNRRPIPCLGPFPASAHCRPINFPPQSHGHRERFSSRKRARASGHPRTSTSSPLAREPAATPSSCTGVSRAPASVAIGEVEGMVLQGPAARSGPIGSFQQSAAAAGPPAGNRRAQGFTWPFDGEHRSLPSQHHPHADRAEIPITREILEKTTCSSALAPRGLRSSTPHWISHTPQATETPDQPRCRGGEGGSRRPAGWSAGRLKS